MDSLPINILDLGVIVVFIVAALIGLAVGFVKGGLFVLSWLGAVLATFYLFPLARPYGRELIETTWIADITAGVAVFLVTLVVLSLLSSLLASWVRDSRLNALDRSLGMVAGLGTAAVVICAVYGVAENVWAPQEQPEWAREARVMPLVEDGARLLRDLVPEDAGEFGAIAADKAREAGKQARGAVEDKMLENLLQPQPRAEPPTTKSQPPGYNSRERKDMDRLIEGMQQQ